MKVLRNIISTQNINVILGVGFIFRLLAVFFARGFGMHDDHYLVIEAGQSFADGEDYNNWLPWHSDGLPTGHSWFYVGIHFIIFKILNICGVADPQMKMIVIRFIHAGYSLLTVYWSYRIMQKLSGEKVALQTAWLLSLLWFIPNASVRNLVEWVCLPPLVVSIYQLVMAEQENDSRRRYILSGIFSGISMGIRLQVVFFIAGIGLYLLLRKKILPGIIWLAGFISALMFTQLTDLFFYGYPFAEVGGYIEYNILHSTDYFNLPWYNYLLTIGGMLIPPVSLLLMFGYLRGGRKYLILVLPALTFFVIHSYFPNKQERFILPFIPFFIMAGLAGWEDFKSNGRLLKWERGVWVFFWTINTPALLVLSTTYSKRSMVEGMYYLYQQQDFNSYIFEVSHKDDPMMAPQFYSGKWNHPYCIYKQYTVGQMMESMKAKGGELPRYILFFQEDDIYRRVAAFKIKTGLDLVYRYTAEPSYFDRLLHWLNPRNKNNPIFIFRIYDRNNVLSSVSASGANQLKTDLMVLNTINVRSGGNSGNF